MRAGRKNKSELADLVEKYDFCSSKLVRIGAIVVPIVLLVLFIIISISEYEIDIFWCGLVLSVILWIVLEAVLLNKRRQLPKEIDKLKKQNVKLYQKIDELTAEVDASVVPKAYRTTKALDYMYDILKDKKALDLEQAIQLYEGNKGIAGKRDKKKEAASATTSYSSTYDDWDSGGSFLPDGVKEGFKGAMGGVHEGTKEVMKVYKTILKDAWKETRKNKRKRK